MCFLDDLGVKENTVLGRTLQCVQRDSVTSEGPSFWGVALCAVGDELDLNPEQQIAAECLVQTGGQPYAFAVCAGGRLTLRELEKCWTDGVGGRGCFGENNEIVRFARFLDRELDVELGPNHELSQAWNTVMNDLENGPGPNNEVAKAFTTVANDIVRGPGDNNEIVRAIDSVASGFAETFGW